MSGLRKVGLGGGCHWCTEAVFQILKGVHKVDQGYISSNEENDYFSEAIIVHYDPLEITLKDLIEIHLHTHESTSNHSFRDKYRSAIYYLDTTKKQEIEGYLKALQNEFKNQLITKVLPFNVFKPSREDIQNYYQKNPSAPFCKRYIHPKMNLLRSNYAEILNPKKVNLKKK